MGFGTRENLLLILIMTGNGMMQNNMRFWMEISFNSLMKMVMVFGMMRKNSQTWVMVFGTRLNLTVI